jgi:hypothetical protein
MKRTSVFLFTVIALAACSESPLGVVQRPAMSVTGPVVTPTIVEGNVSGTGDQVCNNTLVNPTGKKWFGIKVDPAAAGTYAGFTTSLSSDSKYLSWSALQGFVMRAVVVKAGSNTNLYSYGNAAPANDSGLQAPLTRTGNTPVLGYYALCYTIALQVTKTATTSFDRTYLWDVDKTADQSTVTLGVGQAPVPVNYTVTVSKTGATDSNFAVAGGITVQNPASIAAVITSVTDVISGVGAIAVSCPVSFPHSLAGGATLSCTYASALPDNAARTNTATAVTSTPGFDNGIGTASVTFGSTANNEFDECVNVGDSLYGSLGSVCVASLVGSSKAFNYALNFPSTQVPLECGAQSVENTATLTTNDTQATDPSLARRVTMRVG